MDDYYNRRICSKFFFQEHAKTHNIDITLCETLSERYQFHLEQFQFPHRLLQVGLQAIKQVFHTQSLKKIK